MKNYITKREAEFEKKVIGQAECEGQAIRFYGGIDPVTGLEIIAFHRQSLLGLIEEIEQWAKGEEGKNDEWGEAVGLSYNQALTDLLAYLQELKK